MMRRFIVMLLAGVIGFAPALVSAQTTTPTPAPTLERDATAEAPLPVEYLTPEVLNTYPHDTASFTEGLVFHDGKLYESAGEYGASDFRETDLETGEVLRRQPVDAQYFAEGLALVDDKLIQLTWKEDTAFIYDLDTFKQLDTFTYTGEGWGLCYDGHDLWMSDGTDNLVARDPETFEVTRTLPVTYQGQPLSQLITQDRRPLSLLNELECVDDSLYMNVWQTDYIFRVDVITGQVTGVIDASSLLTVEERAALPSGGVLNGIAYNPESETFYLTGKNWPKLFEVTFKLVGNLEG